MADNFTDVLEQGLLNVLGGAASFTITYPLMLALHSANGTDTSTGTEITGGTYARQQITFGAATTTGIANTNLIQFPGMPATTVNSFSIWDSSATPQRLVYGTASSSRSLTAGDTYEVPIGAIVITLA